ncbi:MAG: T9SS type A sorting domain-containing protein, partial [Bacteroidota bacterium]
ALDSTRVSHTLTVSDWTSFNVAIPSYVSADSGKITLGAYFANDQYRMPHGNSVLYVDNLSFDHLITSIGQAEAGDGTFRLYPNPASDMITLKSAKVPNVEAILNIYNGIGESVHMERIWQNQQNIHIGDLSNGVYWLEIRSKDINWNQKLLIRK